MSDYLLLMMLQVLIFLSLKSKFDSTTVSNIKYDRLGEVGGIYDSIETSVFDYKDNVATGEAVRLIGESHKTLFGLGLRVLLKVQKYPVQMIFTLRS